MPELPEVETTRRGIEPAVAGHVIRSIMVREPRLRWRVPRELPEAGRRSAAARTAAAREVPAVRSRARHDDPAPGHVGQPARCCRASTPPALHDHVDIVLDSGLCLRFNDPRRFGSLLWTREDPLQHPLLRSLAPEPLSARIQWRVPGARSRGTQRRDQAAHHERPGRGRRRQHLRERSAVSRRHSSASRRRSASRAPSSMRWRNRSRTCCATRSAPAARRCATTSTRKASPGYFRQKLFVYERTREPCRVCRTPIRQLVQGQRSTYFCPKCQM